jgi:Rod binding domain-containing protein
MTAAADSAPIALAPAPVGAASASLRRAAEHFETMFLAQILRDFTVGTIGPDGGGQSAPFASMLQDEYARLIGRSGGIGIADAVLREMLKAQEVD